MTNRSDRRGEKPLFNVDLFQVVVTIGTPRANFIMARSRTLHLIEAEDTTAV
jgi:hypothetical protein